jgi:hypothetical protein
MAMTRRLATGVLLSALVCCDFNPNGFATAPAPLQTCQEPIVFVSPISCPDDPRCGNVVVDLAASPPEARISVGKIGRLSPRQRVCAGLVTAGYRIVSYQTSDPTVATAEPLVPTFAITECIVTALKPGVTSISATITSSDFPQTNAPLASCTGTCDNPINLVLRVVP